MQLGIFDGERGVAHRAIDVHDGVTGQAAQPVLRFGCVDLILDGLVEAAVEEDRVIVASRTPFGGLRAGHILHVLDGLPIELVVERCKMVSRTVPLVVDVLVALGAQLRIHEEVGRNGGAGVRVRRGWPEGRLRPRTFLGHRNGNQDRIGDPGARVGMDAFDDGGDHGQQQRGESAGQNGPVKRSFPRAHSPDQERDDGGDAHDDVERQQPAVIAGVACDREGHAQQRGCSQRNGGHAADQSKNARRQHEPQHQMEHHIRHVEQRSGAERGDIAGVDQKHQREPTQ